jgi:hypothetical protein
MGGGAAAAELLRRGRGQFSLCALVWGVGAVAGLLLAWKSLGQEDRRKHGAKKEKPSPEAEPLAEADANEAEADR